jgi:hypothetical protein
VKIDIYEKIKSAKPFHKSDILVYFLTALLLCFLFVVFIIFPNKTASDGFRITKDGKDLFFYYSSSKTYKVVSEFENLVVVDDGAHGITIKIFLDQTKKAYNTVFIERSSLSAKVIDANCSNSKDCVHTPPVKESGVIVCAPHRLKICPLVEKHDQPIVG